MKSLLRSELDALLTVAAKYSADDALMFTVTFNHGLRISEALALTSANVVDSHLVVERLKGSKKTIQPLLDSERAGILAKAAKKGRFFLADVPLKYARVYAWRKIRKYGKEAGIPVFKLHPHVLKHTTGRLAYEGGVGIAEIQTYLGHESIKSTGVYMQAPEDVACKAFAAAVGK